MSNLTISVKHLEWGQKPYGPHVYEARITIEGKKSWDKLLEEQVRALVKVVVRNYFTDEEAKEQYPGDPMGRHFLPKLKKLVRVSEETLTGDTLGPQREVWVARVEEPFTD
jgi:hypothetical protein